MTDGWVILISCEISLSRMALNLTDDKPTLVQVMAWSHGLLQSNTVDQNYFFINCKYYFVIYWINLVWISIWTFQCLKSPGTLHIYISELFNLQSLSYHYSMPNEVGSTLADPVGRQAHWTEQPATGINMNLNPPSAGPRYIQDPN